MANDAEVIKEFLVELGFKLDTNSLGKMETAIGKVAGMAFSFVAGLASAAAAMTAFVEKVSAGAEDLYWASIRTRDSVSNIRDFQLQVSKFGGSAEGALNALESISTLLRTNPAGEGYMHMLGIQTRNLNGQLKSSRELLEDFANAPIPYWLKARIGQERFGIDEKTLLAIQQGALKTKTVVSDLYNQIGISADQATAQEHEFNNQMADLEARWHVLSTVLATTFMPAAQQVMQWVQDAVIWFLKLNHETGGAAAIIAGELAGGLGILLAAATIASPAIYGISKAVGLFSGALGLLRSALLAIGLIGEATPFGWIVTGIALFGVLTYEMYAHWDAVKSWFNGVVAWVRDKYNEVAPYLHLPKWEGQTYRESQTSETKSPLAATMPLPGQAPVKAAKPAATPSAPYVRPQPPGPWSLPQPVPVAQPQPQLPASSAQPPQPPLTAPEPPAQRQATGQSSRVTATPLAAATQHAMAYFRAAGWTAEQSAGIVANLIRESGLITNRKGDYNKAGIPQAAGIAQWHPDRQAAFAALHGHGVLSGDLDEQLGFVNHELTVGTEKAAGVALMGAKTAAAAAEIFTRLYERPKDPNSEAPLRGNLATDLLRSTPITAGPTNNQNIQISQKTNINVTSPDPDSAARTTAREQSRVNGDMVRNFAGAVQ